MPKPAAAMEFLLREIKFRLSTLQGLMQEAIKRGEDEGTFSIDVPNWNCTHEVLQASGVLNPRIAGKNGRFPQTEEFWLFEWTTVEGWQTDRKAFEQMMKTYQTLESEMASALGTIPQLIDAEKGIIRWPIGFSLSYSDKGARLAYCLTSCHVRDLCNPYKQSSEVEKAHVQ